MFSFSILFFKINKNKGLEAFTIGCSLMDERKFEDALGYLDTAIKNGIEKAYGERADCLKALGYFIDSIEDYTKAIEHNPTDCNLYFCRGISKNTIGDLAGAIADKHLAINHSKLKNSINSNRDKVANSLGAKTLTEYYELYTASWEQDLEFDIQMRDKFSKIKDVEQKNKVLKMHVQKWEIFHKKR